MKKLKKLISLVLVVTLVFANSIMAFADDGDCTHTSKTLGAITWTDNDCTKGGTQAWTCDNAECGETGTQSVSPQSSHNYVEGTCSRCGKTEPAAPPCTHTYNTLPNKCDICGQITPHECDYDGTVLFNEVAWTDNDCTKGGTATKPCDLCGEDMSVPISAEAAHIRSEQVTDGEVTWHGNDCTHGGTASIACDVCGTNFNVEVEAKEGHSYVPLENYIGSYRHTCTVCGTDFIIDYPDDTGCDHEGDYGLTDVDWNGDCTQNGIIQFTCKNCGKTVSATVARQSFHDYEDTGFCNICGYECTHQGEVIPYHVYASNGQHVRKFECAVCHKLDVTPVGLIDPDIYDVECEKYETFESVDGTNHMSYCSVCEHTIEVSAPHRFDTDGKCADCDYQCAHVEKRYTHNDGAQTHKITCANCGMLLNASEECDKPYVSVDKKKHHQECSNCLEVHAASENHNFDATGKCDKCGYQCSHETIDVQSTFNGDNTHTTKCKNCQKVMAVNTPCTFTNNVCDVCGGIRVCHHDGKLTYTWVSGSTHRSICDICGEIVNPSLSCTYNEYANKCDECKHITEHSHTYNANGVCTRCGVECSHSTMSYTPLGNNKHAVICSTCSKVIKVSEDCTFYGGTICSKCETQHTHKYNYENISNSQHRLTCTICNATATESHQIYFEYKGYEDEEYEHYRKCRLCDFSKIESCSFNKNGKRCEYCDHKKSKEEQEEEEKNKNGENTNNNSSSAGAYDYVHGLINGGNISGAIDAMKAEPLKYLKELRDSGIALPKGTVIAITGNEFNEVCAVESNARDTNNQLMYANYFGTQLGFTKFSPTKTYNIYPFWSPAMKDSAAIISWANTGCVFGDTVYVVWYSYEAHDMRFIPAVVDQGGIVSVAIPKVSSMAQMTIVKCEKEVPKTTKSTTTTKKEKTKAVEAVETTEENKSEKTIVSVDAPEEEQEKEKTDNKKSDVKTTEISNKKNNETTSLTVKTD